MSDRLGSPRVSRSVTGAVVAGIRDLILSGQLPPGSRLLQDQLCRDFNVSASSVREAMRELENEGLVRREPNRGVFVTDLGDEELLRVLHPVRLTLEGFAIEKIVERRDTVNFNPLQDIVAEMAAAAQRNDLVTVHDLDVRFHEWLVHTSEQPHTIQLWRSILPRVRAQFIRLGGYHSSPSVIVDEHTELLDAVRTWDLAQIHTLLEEHIAGAAQQLLARRSTGSQEG